MHSIRSGLLIQFLCLFDTLVSPEPIGLPFGMGTWGHQGTILGGDLIPLEKGHFLKMGMM